MQMRLRFLGAAQNVTGSRHLLEVNGIKILVDCGLYQERNLRGRNWEPFVVPPTDIDAVFLTHAHLDHCGLLPKLVREGFSGRIYCTPATQEIAKIILLDAAKIQEEDAKYKLKRHKREKRKSPFPVVPLYTIEDAQACFPLFTSIGYGQDVRIAAGVQVRLYEAGHVLGSAAVKITAENSHGVRSVLFSGDIGRPNQPIVRDPAIVHGADYVLVESTYGDRVHHDQKNIKELIADVVNSTAQQGGSILVPSFALERSQELLYYISELRVEGAIPNIRVFLDSPMATRITKVFQHHPEMFDQEMMQHLRNHESPFRFKGLELVESRQQSKAINDFKGPAIIIAGSGMCTGGRIKHHLAKHITRPQDTVMFVGYQAIGTLGRRLVEGEKEVRILGKEYPVQAKVTQVHGFSAHADKTELLAWLQGLGAPPRRVFVVHGETESAQAFGQYLREQTSWDVHVPSYQDTVVLE
jgi:metallo-beta-lactamase family protein